MKVRALSHGFYQNARRRPGVVFDLVSDKHFSNKWMESLEAPVAAKVEAPKVEEVEAPKGKPGRKPREQKSSGDVEVI